MIEASNMNIVDQPGSYIVHTLEFVLQAVRQARVEEAVAG